MGNIFITIIKKFLADAHIVKIAPNYGIGPAQSAIDISEIAVNYFRFVEYKIIYAIKKAMIKIALCPGKIERIGLCF